MSPIVVTAGQYPLISSVFGFPRHLNDPFTHRRLPLALHGYPFSLKTTPLTPGSGIKVSILTELQTNDKQPEDISMAPPTCLILVSFPPRYPAIQTHPHSPGGLSRPTRSPAPTQTSLLSREWCLPVCSGMGTRMARFFASMAGRQSLPPLMISTFSQYARAFGSPKIRHSETLMTFGCGPGGGCIFVLTSLTLSFLQRSLSSLMQLRRRPRPGLFRRRNSHLRTPTTLSSLGGRKGQKTTQ